MPKPLVWKKIQQEGEDVPTARSGYTLTKISHHKSTYVMFGGMKFDEELDTAVATNEVYYVHLKGQKATWNKMVPKGDRPLQRCYHSACRVGNQNSEMVYLFGGMYSSNQRFNDSYFLKIGYNSPWLWTQPPNQKSGGEPKNAESKIGAPAPRSHHTATPIGNKVMIFGGVGGIGFKRQVFNDIYIIDLENYEWEEKDPEGKRPPERSGHSACVLPYPQGGQPDRVAVYGGWGIFDMRADMWIYNINDDEWIEPDFVYDQPRWNHSSFMYAYPPAWKYFVFGGSVGVFEDGTDRTLGHFTNSLHVFDVEGDNWSGKKIELEIEEGVKSKTPVLPKERDSCKMIFNDNQIVIFGGWNNKWLDDMWCLNTSKITGPKYAIYSIGPKRGPVTGKTKVHIKGVGFKQNGNMEVMFKVGSKEKLVSGNWIADSECYCETPSFVKEGPREAQVFLKQDGNDYTLQEEIFFQYYLNTMASSTIAFGPGVINKNPVGHDVIFNIQARNTIGANRKSGSDRFFVKILRDDDAKKLLDPKMKEEGEGEEGDAPEEVAEESGGDEDGEEDEDKKKEMLKFDPAKLIPAEVIDLDNGTYEVKYKNDTEENLRIWVYY